MTLAQVWAGAAPRNLRSRPVGRGGPGGRPRGR